MNPWLVAALFVILLLQLMFLHRCYRVLHVMNKNLCGGIMAQNTRDQNLLKEIKRHAPTA